MKSKLNLTNFSKEARGTKSWYTV